MNEAPEKIYGWLDTQLSIARHYGGMKFRGASYVIDFNDPDQPLVRQDIFQAEKKAKKAPKVEQKTKMNDLFLGGQTP
jgi:hypothetical protein